MAVTRDNPFARLRVTNENDGKVLFDGSVHIPWGSYVAGSGDVERAMSKEVERIGFRLQSHSTDDEVILRAECWDEDGGEGWENGATIFRVRFRRKVVYETRAIEKLKPIFCFMCENEFDSMGDLVESGGDLMCIGCAEKDGKGNDSKRDSW